VLIILYKDSFAWKDTTLDRKLKELKEKKLSEAPEPRNRWAPNSWIKGAFSRNNRV
jgi:hypothetical protein